MQRPVRRLLKNMEEDRAVGGSCEGISRASSIDSRSNNAEQRMGWRWFGRRRKGKGWLLNPEITKLDGWMEMTPFKPRR